LYAADAASTASIASVSPIKGIEPNMVGAYFFDEIVENTGEVCPSHFLTHHSLNTYLDLIALFIWNSSYCIHLLFYFFFVLKYTSRLYTVLYGETVTIPSHDPPVVAFHPSYSLFHMLSLLAPERQ
jgi:hypothetical protein